MNEQLTALQHFEIWLPGEVKYSAEKAPFPNKLKRARTGRIAEFLGAEWFHARLLRKEGKHHSREHEKTAQLQFAKFASGLVDKMAMTEWVRLGQSQDIEEQVRISQQTAGLFVSKYPSPADQCLNAEEVLKTAYDDTIFAPGITQAEITLDAASLTGATNTEELMVDLSFDLFNLASAATTCYLAYAEEHLSSDQYHLAPSELVA